MFKFHIRVSQQTDVSLVFSGKELNDHCLKIKENSIILVMQQEQNRVKLKVLYQELGVDEVV